MRADGKRVKCNDPMYALIPYFLKHRWDSMNMITLDIPEVPLKECINRKRTTGSPVSHLALLIAAYIQCIDEFPALNRFVINQKIFQRNEISVSMVVMIPGSFDSAMSKIYFDPDDTLDIVQQKIDKYIVENRNAERNNAMDKWMKLLCKSSFLCKIIMATINQADKWGWLPKSVIDASPFHASILVSNLASIRTNHIYHHVYEFGTTSVSLTMGNMVEVPKRSRGTVEFERCIPLGLVMDERICNGHYFAMAFARMRSYLTHPEQLEIPFSQKKIDICFQGE